MTDWEKIRKVWGEELYQKFMKDRAERLGIDQQAQGEETKKIIKSAEEERAEEEVLRKKAREAKRRMRLWKPKRLGGFLK